MPATSLDWNLVVTARGGRRQDLVRALRPIVRLRRAGYPDVLTGRVDDVDACLDAIGARADAAFRAEILARVVPVVRTFALELDRLDDQLAAEAAGLVDRVAGRSFHVRVERRGHGDRVDSSVLERRLGTLLVAALRAQEAPPRVTFDDPDVIVVVELIGMVGGIGLVSRALRARHSFVRV